MRFCLVVGFVAACSSPGMESMKMPDLGGLPVLHDLGPAPPDFSLPRRDPTSHPALIQLDNLGGPPLSAMEIVTVVWPGDEALGARVAQFHAWMLKSNYWVQSLSEYGVGAGRGVGLVVLPTAAPATIDDSWLHTNIKAYIASGVLPQPNANTTYAFVFPTSSQSTMCYGGGCQYGCQDYGGYHAETATTAGGSAYVPYEVNLQCPGGGGNPFDQLTEVLSHEAAEVASDAHPFTRPGWVNRTFPLGGEVGDLCVGLMTHQSATIDVPDAGAVSETYLVTRLYSHRAAVRGTSDPCVPAPNRPYFNVGVEPPDWVITADASGNATDTAKIEPYAFGDVGAIKWRFEGRPGQGITLTPSSGTAMPGDTIWLTATVSGASPGTYPITILAQTTSGAYNQWFSMVTIQ